MKKLPKRLQMTLMTEMTFIDHLYRVKFYLDDWEDRVTFWSDLEMLSDDWDYQDDQGLSQKSSLSFH